MDSLEDLQELIIERNNHLPPLLSNLGEDNLTNLLDSLQVCTKYLPTYNSSNVNQELLRHIIPVVKNSLLKVYEDNILLSETVKDEFVVTILRENLKVAVGLVQIIRYVLEFLTQCSEIVLDDLSYTPVNLVLSISSTFEHCKNSSDVYKQFFNVELLDLCRTTQDVHLLFLKLFETNIVIKNDSESSVEEINILCEVLDIICIMSKILSDMNIKSLSDNWKSYIAISQKFSAALQASVNLKLPFADLSSELKKKLSSIEVQNQIDIKLATQSVKISSFLIKVALKICDVFWNSLHRVLEEVFKFCCTVYSFPVDLYRSKGYQSEALLLIETAIFKTVEPLLLRLYKDPQCVIVFCGSEDRCSHHSHFGLINLLNEVLKIAINQPKPSQLSIDGIVNTIFNSVSSCFAEFFLESEPMECIFDSLVLNITASVVLYEECYGEVEIILLKNLLQEHIFAALLALEVWTLLLRNSTPPFRLLTLTSLVQKVSETDFGLMTNRLEPIYLKCFMQRLFKMLPNNAKNDFVLRFNPVRTVDCWRIIQFRNFPFQQRLSIEGVCLSTVDRIEKIKNGSASFKDILFVAENLEMLSTANFSNIGLNPKNLTKAVDCLWGFNAIGNVVENHIMKYFITALLKITSSLSFELTSKQFLTVLSQLKILSTSEFYKVLVSDFLSVTSKKCHDNIQDNFRISTLISEIICHNLLNSASNIVKQGALEAIDSLARHGKHNDVKNILRLSNDMHGEITDYLQRNVASTSFDKQYFELLGSYNYRHECMRWKVENDFPKTKKLRYDDRVAEEVKYTVNFSRKKEVMVKQAVKPSKWCKEVNISVKSPDENKEEGNIAEVIGNIRGEVKCLLKLLQNEKMTAKNASDVRMIANQLLSLL